ncbi:MAG TPA: GSCFA domain-containing protein [Saprospiraceae bacterium]|nr:GSCFA domain-containing protein [Saprospiraceae bacterium]
MITRTAVHIHPINNKISYQKPIFLIGSCFSDNIGNQFKLHRFNHCANPFGTVYNPISISDQIVTIQGKRELDQKKFVFRDDRVYHLDFHSQLFTRSIEEYTHVIDAKAQSTLEYLSQASHVFITLGTAWVYIWNETHQSVANCHKLAAHHFTKKLISIDVITGAIQDIITQIQLINPYASIIFTVSPVRHLKDGFIENTRSKARLIEAIHNVTDGQRVHYFPIFELMIDDLRDYRYYQEDMLHPSNPAIKYIWEQLCSSICDETTLQLMKMALKIETMKMHKPFDDKSSAYQQHLQKINTLELEWKKSIN